MLQPYYNSIGNIFKSRNFQLFLQRKTSDSNFKNEHKETCISTQQRRKYLSSDSSDKSSSSTSTSQTTFFRNTASSSKISGENFSFKPSIASSPRSFSRCSDTSSSSNSSSSSRHSYIDYDTQLSHNNICEIGSHPVPEYRSEYILLVVFCGIIIDFLAITTISSLFSYFLDKDFLSGLSKYSLDYNQKNSFSDKSELFYFVHFTTLSKLQMLISSSQFIGFFLLSYVFVVFLLRYQSCGAYILYELLQGCNLSMIIAGLGGILGYPFFIAISMCQVAVDQFLWYIDLGTKLIFGFYPIGVAKYLSSDIPLILKITAFHHLQFIPLCLFLLRNIGIPNYTFYFLIISAFTVICYTRFAVPYQVLIQRQDEEECDNANTVANVSLYSDNINGQTRKSNLRVIRMNINMAYHFYEDVDFYFLHILDNKPWFIYLPLLTLFGNILLNGPFYILLCWISNRLLI